MVMVLFTATETLPKTNTLAERVEDSQLRKLRTEGKDEEY